MRNRSARDRRVFGSDPGFRTCSDPQCTAPPVSDIHGATCEEHTEAARRTRAKMLTRESRQPDSGAGFVYFMRVGDLVKIGWSRTPERRADQLHADAVLHVEPGTKADEARLHAAFAHLREHHEYFRPGPDLMSFVLRLHAA